MFLNIRYVQLKVGLTLVQVKVLAFYSHSLIPRCSSALIPDLLLKFMYKWSTEMVICFTARMTLGHVCPPWRVNSIKLKMNKILGNNIIEGPLT
ncbi:Uncharacterized protein DAT39_023644 [Clarias magur]|uniref:Uncharacterized protein n=1 Tax=Clarias magur TaxID=1594786 RepID=A0A8J4T0F9_CLAMG|nr:Uncharacterized protein DAT39_023644 [Clarias magur]